MSRRLAGPRFQRRAGLALTLAVAWMQWTLVVVFWSAALRAPLPIDAAERLWVRGHQRLAELLVMVVIGSAVLSVAGLACRGPHRWLLAGTWLAALAVMIAGWGAEVAVMLRVIWWQLT
jgi:hypothetical protein